VTDPYVYPGTDVLVNHFDVRDDDRLGRIERLVSFEAMVEIMRDTTAKHSFDFDTLSWIHRKLFEDVYPFAGELRTVEISKPETVLSGRSIRYGRPGDIAATAHAAIHTLHAVDYGQMNGPKGWPLFAEGLATLWRAHAFREGNTRAVLTFAHLLLRAHGCETDFSVISRNPAATRDELVRASEGYGRGLATLFAEARASFVRRSHPVLGYLSEEQARLVEAISPDRPLPSRNADATEAVRGAVLFQTSDTVVLQTTKGLVGVSAASFDEIPQPGTRVSVIAAGWEAAASDRSDFKVSRAMRNAILARPADIEFPDGPDGFLSFPFDDPTLRHAAAASPGLVSRIAGNVLQSFDVESWDDWVSGRYYAAARVVP
jgi:cell filamentation protein